MSEPISTGVGVTALTALGASVGLVFGPHIALASLFTSFVGASFFIYRNHKPDGKPVFEIIALFGWWFASLFIAEAAHWVILHFGDVELPPAVVPALSGLVAWLFPEFLLRLPELIRRLEGRNTFPWIGFKE